MNIEEVKARIKEQFDTHHYIYLRGWIYGYTDANQDISRDELINYLASLTPKPEENRPFHFKLEGLI
jgi:hypothetical protein